MSWQSLSSPSSFGGRSQSPASRGYNGTIYHGQRSKLGHLGSHEGLKGAAAAASLLQYILQLVRHIWSCEGLLIIAQHACRYSRLIRQLAGC